MTVSTRISTSDLARIVGCTAKFVRDKIRGGHLETVRTGNGNPVGSRLRISRAEAIRDCRFLQLGKNLVVTRVEAPAPVVMDLEAALEATLKDVAKKVAGRKASTGVQDERGKETTCPLVGGPRYHEHRHSG